MKTLSKTWFAEGYIDFELKKYTLLAYLQQIHTEFTQNKLYPQLSDIIFHYNNMLHFKYSKQLMQEQFPKKFTHIDVDKLQILYEKIVDDDEMMKELEDIIQYAIQNMSATIKDGAEIYEFVEEKLNILPVGIVPLENREGYFFLCDGKYSDTRVYYYRLSIFEKHDEKYRSIKTSFVAEWQRNFVNTYENIKTELIRNKTELPNPAVYSIETDLSYPLEETLLPIAKRSLVKYITENAAA
ncbi:hypothetical protein DC498_00600 [Terrimonas sp.]|uniref:hypothetical protein n=1 Tax=Terrimonas sp. TaxID=1914338 RepID=UPI000926A1A8|nr:hypothetical protein [Terrimonas sp.]OJY93259.1 MAG: hypothetical protein BGP13_16630 [Sphingobacteriales bacterium 40-81]PVD53929.1 hypothetical protein DC498_00600 [Terrimonas sp.]